MKTRADLLFIKEAIEEAASEEIGKKVKTYYAAIASNERPQKPLPN